MTATTLAPPRRRVQRVDMNARLATLATKRGLSAEIMDLAANRLYVAEVRRQFAMLRPQFGLGGQVTDLMHLQLPGAVKIDNVKIAKNELATLSLTMASHRVRLADDLVLNTCPWAGACARVCVLSHGRGTWDKVQAARKWRTACLHANPLGFLVLLRHEIERAHRKVGGEFLARLNVNSDLPWHLFPALFAGVPILAYDYTKDPGVLEGDGWCCGGNYRRIYSWNETSDVGAVWQFMQRGGSIAMVTNRKKGQPVEEHRHLPMDDWMFPVVDGDLTDDRWHTPRGVIVDLYAKGDARTKASPFVVRSY